LKTIISGSLSFNYVSGRNGKEEEKKHIQPNKIHLFTLKKNIALLYLCRRHFFAKPDLRQLFSSQGPML
jgi:hypothetical protein